jgi:hypothetical protein
MTQVNEELLKQLETAQQESFKYIAFSGGGAKGNIYSGVHETLKQSGVLDGVEEVAGSSAGAITVPQLWQVVLLEKIFKNLVRTLILKSS